MDTQTDLSAVEKWRTRLEQWGMLGIADVLLIGLSPLAPIGAQLLYIAQPVLGLVWKRHSIDEWANLLENPHGLDWLREQLQLTENTPDE
jgi:hypothetical protein